MSELSTRMARFEEAHESSVLRIERSLGALTLASASGVVRSMGEADSSAAAPAAALAAPVTPTTRPPVPPAVGAHRGLDRRDVGAGSAQQQEYSFASRHGGAFYLDCADNFENLPVNLSNDRRISEGKRVLKVYRAMATPEERAVVVCKPRNEAQANIIARDLGKLLLKRFAAAYRDSGQSVPPRLFSGSLLLNSVVEHLGKSRLVVDAVAFAEWRKAGASDKTGAVVASSQPSASQPSAASPKRPAAEEEEEDEGPRKSPRPLGASLVRIETAAAAEASDSGGSSPASDGQLEPGSVIEVDFLSDASDESSGLHL